MFLSKLFAGKVPAIFVLCFVFVFASVVNAQDYASYEEEVSFKALLGGSNSSGLSAGLQLGVPIENINIRVSLKTDFADDFQTVIDLGGEMAFGENYYIFIGGILRGADLLPKDDSLSYLSSLISSPLPQYNQQAYNADRWTVSPTLTMYKKFTGFTSVGGHFSTSTLEAFVSTGLSSVQLQFSIGYDALKEWQTPFVKGMVSLDIGQAFKKGTKTSCPAYRTRR